LNASNIALAHARGWLAALSRVLFEIVHNNIFDLLRRLRAVVAAIDFIKVVSMS